MKPRKKQRVESEGKHEMLGRKREQKDVDSEDPEDSLEDEGLEELIDDEGGEDDVDGKNFISSNTNKNRRNGHRRCTQLRGRRTGRFPRC